MNINTKRLLKLTEDMVNIYSPTGKEKSVVDYVYNIMSKHGFQPELQNVEKDRNNVIIHAQAETPMLCFAGHLDTVVAYDYDHYELYREDDELYGLGTSDMKGACAAMMEAFISYWEKHKRLPAASLALLVGEEENGDGAQCFLEEYHYPWAIMGEPTKLQTCFQHYGYIEANVNTTGYRRHAALADKESNAVQAMLEILLKLSDYISEEKQDIIFNIRDLSSSQTGFAVPDSCDAWLDFHLPPQHPAGDMIFDIEDFIRQTLHKDSPLRDIIHFTTIHSGFSIPEKGPFVDTLKKAFANCGHEWVSGFFPSDSDAIFFWDSGIRTIILGPGSLEKAHRQDESIDAKELIKAAEIYFAILESLDA